MRFIDLFAGLGGFHVALSALGHQCVMASELNAELAELYERNFGIRPAGDIRKINPTAIPDHDILCAGFPCQPFSKAGDQRGLQCPAWGDLIDYVIGILRRRQPGLFIIENVPNLVRHNEGETWANIRERLEGAGYDVYNHQLSPHIFGIPQIRERTFIVGSRRKLAGFKWPAPDREGNLSIRTVLDEYPAEARPLPEKFIQYLDTWQDFLKRFPKEEELPSFPIWAMEFRATYPYTDRTPHAVNFRELSEHFGSFGEPLRGLSPDETRKALPPYAREEAEIFASWKIDFIRKNRQFYQRYKGIIDPWLPRIQDFAPSFQKLEWNCKGCERDIWKYVIQFRASGIRVKRPMTAPSLVAMTTSQVPVIGWERRYMTPRECSRLQSMGMLDHLPSAKRSAYRALGNAVNATVVEAIVSKLAEAYEHSRNQTASAFLQGSPLREEAVSYAV